MAYMSETHRTTAEDVEGYLRTLFKHALESSRDIHPTYEQLWIVMQDIMFAGGKRVRPYLTALGYQLGPDHTTDITPVAAAQELLHVAMLVHDDIIDRDTTRHSQLNINGRYEALYAPFVGGVAKTHYAHSASILAGDLLISAAYRAISTSEFNPADQRIALDMLHNSIFEVVGGELMDVEASFVTNGAYDSITIARHKTAAYTVAGPLLTGAKLAHAPESMCQHLSDYALNIGIAFQIQDDLLGLFGDESVTGKSTVSDIREGKQTFLIEQFRAHATDDELQLLDATLGKPDVSDETIEHLKAVIKTSSAYEATLQAIQSYVAAADTALDSIDESTSKQELIALTKRLSQRVH